MNTKHLQALDVCFFSFSILFKNEKHLIFFSFIIFRSHCALTAHIIECSYSIFKVLIHRKVLHDKSSSDKQAFNQINYCAHTPDKYNHTERPQIPMTNFIDIFVIQHEITVLRPVRFFSSLFSFHSLRDFCILLFVSIEFQCGGCRLHAWSLIKTCFNVRHDNESLCCFKSFFTCFRILIC